jgi:hypothetical protein
MSNASESERTGHLGAEPQPKGLEEKFDNISATAIQPELRLMAMIMEDAVGCYQRFVDANDAAGREQFEDAEAWLFNDDQDWIFSFRNICEFIGVNPGAVRRGLLGWKAEVLSSAADKRPRLILHRRIGKGQTRPASKKHSPHPSKNTLP